VLRRAGTILLTAIAIDAMPATADCQYLGRWNPALTYHNADAAALGTPGRGFLEYGTSDSFGYTAEAGIGTLGGMLRATYAHGYQRAIWGLGYARMLAAKDAGKLGTWGAGVDVSGAMDFYQPAALASRAGRMSIPLSLRWGSPTRLSIAPYVAPVGEIGRETSYVPAPGCDPNTFCSYVPGRLLQTHALGLASGVQLTAWRASLEIGLRDLPRTRFGYTEYTVGVGLRLRF
jgi:hypothetical protein